MIDHEQELYDLLTKEAVDILPETSVGADEKMPASGPRTALYNESTKPKDPADAPLQHTAVAKEEHEKVRQGVLDNAFNHQSESDKAEQAFVSKNLEHGASGDFSTHSVHLQDKAKDKVAFPRSSSLTEQVRRMFGRT